MYTHLFKAKNVVSLLSLQKFVSMTSKKMFVV